jgi:putative glutamine amidotransferase
VNTPRIGIALPRDITPRRRLLARALGRQTLYGPVTWRAAQLVRQAVRSAGGEPIDADGAAATGLDGLILMHGPDLDPALYGAEPQDGTTVGDREDDARQVALARAAVSAGLPVLGICRGAHVLNVALGGTLVQEVGSSGVRHAGDWAALRHAAPGGGHPVRTDPGSRAERWTGGLAAVNSFHHQAVAEPGDGLVITARAPDGTAEAVEAADGRPVTGIQWHHEFHYAADAGRSTPFDELVQAARAMG